MSQLNNTNSTVAEAGSEYKPSNFRIFSVRTGKRMLHVEDCLHINRIRFDLWAYEKGNGSTGHVDAYLTVDDARLLGYLLTIADTSTPIERNGGGVVKGNVIARIFQMEKADNANHPVRITITNAPGNRQQSGLISINKGASPTKLQILLSTEECCKLGLALREHLQAWSAATYTARVNAGTYHPAPLGDGDIIDEQDTPPAGDDPDDKPEPVKLAYADGSLVSDNQAEIDAYTLYCERMRAKPEDIGTLRQWLRTQNRPK